MSKRWILVAALVGWSGCSPLQGGINHGTGGNGGTGGTGGGGGGDDGSLDMSVDESGDGGSAYNGDFAVNSMCVPPQMAAMCPSPIPANAGCKAAEDCGSDGSGNGVDDNCNGTVDEGCPCTPGAVEKCFLGPPGRRGVGGCTDGSATCAGSEFGAWGPCIGSIGPAAESCDKLDNDCNGCADDGLCCNAAINCPAPGDPRIAPQAPYTDVALKGELFFPGAAKSWSWTIVGGPCDQLFYATTKLHNQSFTLTGANMKDAVAHFTLSGDYTVTLTVVGADGVTYTCTWVQHILGPGVRFELCWDNSDSGDDIDLHVHKPGTTTAWFSTTNDSSNNNPDDCFYENCKADEYPSGSTGTPIPDWSDANSPLAECIGSPSGMDWQMNLNACHNPRLDIDNVGGTPGIPENINIDDPKNGQTFRAAVHYYANISTTDEHPMVNVYCGGTLKATFGKAPNTLSGFKTGSGYGKGLLWRVADVQVAVDASGNTTDCTVTAIHPPGSASGYYTTTNNMAY